MVPEGDCEIQLIDFITGFSLMGSREALLFSLLFAI